MPRVKLSEFRSKSIVNEALGTKYTGLEFDADRDNVAKFDDYVAPQKSYVVKVDQGIKKRLKQGLVKLDITGIDSIVDSIAELRKKGFSQFLVEEMVPHTPEEERYLALERTDKGLLVYYSTRGGVDIEDHGAEVKTELVRDVEDVGKIALTLDINPDFLKKLIEAFDINYFSFLEINPLVISFKTPYMLDIASEVDSAAEFFVDTWSLQDTRETGRRKTPEEENIDKLVSKSQASFKLVVLNPNGSIFMLLSGGGASIVLADEVTNLGAGDKLSNYGEYSGNPNEEETYIYTKNVLSLLLKSNAQNKVLIIGGGVANFTDVRITFRGVIRALEEVRAELKRQDVGIFVRRGGPNLQEGLEMMRKFMKENGIRGEVHGPELILTDIVSKAIK